jgi:hypothetical protein
MSPESLEVIKNWVLTIALSQFMDDTPGMHGGPPGVRRCLKAVYLGTATEAQLLLTREIHEYYNASLYKRGLFSGIDYPSELSQRCQEIIERRRKQGERS